MSAEDTAEDRAANSAACVVDINWDTPAPAWLPAETALQDCVCRAVAEAEPALLVNGAEVSLLFTDDIAISTLNGTYRGKPVPTNVLSFAERSQLEQGRMLLGDIVICPAVVETEAKAQGKTPAAHLLHLVIHGSLHLLGYDHEEDAEAERMENLEIKLLAGLGQADPYAMLEPMKERLVNSEMADESSVTGNAAGAQSAMSQGSRRP